MYRLYKTCTGCTYTEYRMMHGTYATYTALYRVHDMYTTLYGVYTEAAAA